MFHIQKALLMWVTFLPTSTWWMTLRGGSGWEALRSSVFWRTLDCQSRLWAVREDWFLGLALFQKLDWLLSWSVGTVRQTPSLCGCNITWNVDVLTSVVGTQREHLWTSVWLACTTKWQSARALPVLPRCWNVCVGSTSAWKGWSVPTAIRLPRDQRTLLAEWRSSIPTTATSAICVVVCASALTRHAEERCLCISEERSTLDKERCTNTCMTWPSKRWKKTCQHAIVVTQAARARERAVWRRWRAGREEDCPIWEWESSTSTETAKRDSAVWRTVHHLAEPPFRTSTPETCWWWLNRPSYAPRKTSRRSPSLWRRIARKPRRLPSSEWLLASLSDLP